MKQWEDIFKDKLEGYESSLPEGSLADFRARLEESRKPSRKSSGVRPWWIAALSATAAACLALFFTLGNKDASVEPENMVAEVIPVDSSDVVQLAEAVQDETPVVVVKNLKVTEPSEVVEATEPEHVTETKESDKTEEVSKEESVDEQSNSSDESVNIPSFPGPSVSSHTVKKSPLRINVRSGVGTAVRGIAGMSAVGGVLASSGAFKPVRTSSSDDSGNGNHQVIRDPLLDTTYRAPVKVGVGIRYALANRLYISSGVGYSQYSTTYKFTYRGEVDMVARYISVPIRVDYGIVQSRWADVYLGAGGTADFCISANLDGGEFEKDGTTYSLVGVAGVQLNITKRIGAFIEPRISWAIPSEKRILETYRYMHPFAFDVSTGIRFTLGKR